MLAAWVYVSCYYHFPNLPSEGIKGTAHLEISALSTYQTHFGQGWLYRCHLKNFFPADSTSASIAHHLPCSILIPHKNGLKRPLANQNYIVSAILMKNSTGQYHLKMSRDDPWHPVANSWSMAEGRYQAKRWLAEVIKKHIPHLKSGSFLTGLATGEFEDRLLQRDLARFGLQHIMAISGFHFSILAGMLNLFCRLLMPRKAAILSLIVLLSLYGCFLGCSPSILRAWMMMMLFLGSQLFEKQSQALNSLGVALLGVLAIDPLLCQTIGFQFSFLVTLAILLAYAPSDYYLTHLLPKRPLSQMIKMDGWNQHGYYFLALFRQGLALTIAVNLFALPVTLYYFQQFSWMSLIYNLFFPFLVSVSMSLLLVGLILSLLVPVLGQAIHNINSVYTKWILSLTSNMPLTWEGDYTLPSFPAWMLIAYLCLVCLMGMIMKQRLREERLDKQDFAFI